MRESSELRELITEYFESFTVGSPDWVARHVLNGAELRLIGTSQDEWLDVSVDMTPFAGQQVVLKIENKANNWQNEWAYWKKNMDNALPIQTNEKENYDGQRSAVPEVGLQYGCQGSEATNKPDSATVHVC